MAFELALDAGDQNNTQNSTANRSLIPTTGNALATRVELRPLEKPDPLAEITSIMHDQATRIQELERNLE